MNIALMIVSIIFVFIAGYLTGRRKRSKPESLGVLQLDHSDPEMPYLFLLDCDLDYIATKKQATFDVKVEDFISQK